MAPVWLFSPVLSRSFVPCSENMTVHSCVTAEITYSTAYECHELLTWSWAPLCSTPVWASSWRPWLPLHWGYTGVTSWLRYMKLCYGNLKATLWLCYGCSSSCHVGQDRDWVAAAVPARREWACLQFPWFLESSSSLLACALPTLGAANSGNSKTTGVTNRNSDTLGQGKTQSPKALNIRGFPGGSDGKESACNEEDNKNH